MKPPIDWREVARVYAQSKLSFNQIAAKLGVTAATVRRHARADGWSPSASSDVGPERTRQTGRTPSTDLSRMVVRLYSALDQQMTEIEERLAMASTATERERDARTLNALTRTLEKLIELKQIADTTSASQAKEGKPESAAKLRTEIERRLDKLLEATAATALSRSSHR